MTRRFVVFYSVFAYAACGDGYYDVVLRQREVLRVAPLVAEAAAWNAYVADDAAELVDVSGAPCTSPASYRSCLGAGALRRVEVPGYESCANLSITDSLDAFVWSCAVRDGGVVFFSSALRDGRGLRDLVDFATPAFRHMRVVVLDASTGATFTSPNTVWWDNPVVALPAGSGVIELAAADTVYVVAHDTTAVGIDIVEDGVSLVTAPSVRLTYAGGGADRCSGMDPSDMSEPAMQCFVTGEHASRLWVEAELAEVNVGNYQMVFDHVSLLRLHATTIGHATSSALKLGDVTASRVTNLQVARGGSLFVVRGGGNLIQDLRLAVSDVFLYATHANVFDRVTTFGRFAGVDIHGGCTDNTVARLLSFSHSAFGVQLVGAGNVGNTVAGFTIANTQAAGLGFWTNVQSTVHLGLIANAGQHGLDVQGSATAVSSLASLANAYSGVAVQAPGANQRFSGMLVLGDANGVGNCAIGTGPTNPGLTSSCGPQGLSPSSLTTLTSPFSIADTFVGPVEADDPDNRTDELGRATLTSDISAFDVLGASTRYRGWSRAGATFLGADERGCPGASSCWLETGSSAVRLVDWRLRASAVANLSSSGTAIDFVSDATCPAAVHGDRVAYDLHGGERSGDAIGNDDGLCEPGEACDGNTYLLSALEVIDDRRGDDDGLCESAEACIVAPNFGTYQGHGDYAEHRCAFVDGIVYGVTMFGYPENGI